MTRPQTPFDRLITIANGRDNKPRACIETAQRIISYRIRIVKQQVRESADRHEGRTSPQGDPREYASRYGRFGVEWREVG